MPKKLLQIDNVTYEPPVSLPCWIKKKISANGKFKIPNITETDILKIINELSAQKATGVDIISGEYLKYGGRYNQTVKKYYR